MIGGGRGEASVCVCACVCVGSSPAVYPQDRLQARGIGLIPTLVSPYLIQTLCHDGAGQVSGRVSYLTPQGEVRWHAVISLACCSLGVRGGGGVSRDGKRSQSHQSHISYDLDGEETLVFVFLL